MNQMNKKMISKEVNALLEDVVAIANAKGPDGYSIFSGTKIDSEAFKVTRENKISKTSKDGAGPQIIKVEYNGNQAEKKQRYTMTFICQIITLEM